jgi:outer membrane protein assembly factor BamB
VWSVPNGTSAAVVDGSSVFAAQRGPGTGSSVVARDLINGTPRWTHVVPNSQTPSRLAADGTGGTLYTAAVVTSGSGKTSMVVAALSQATGQQQWNRSRTIAGSRIWLTFGDGRLFVGSESGTTAFAANGNLLWTRPSAETGSYANGRYYTGDAVLNAATGAVLWRENLQPTFLPVMPTVSGARVLVGGANGLANDTRDGVLAWYPASGCGKAVCTATRAVETDGRQFLPITSQSDTALAWTFSGVQAYSLTSGRQLWKETADQDLLAARIAADLVWTVDGDGTFRAYRLAGCGAATCPAVRTFTTRTAIAGPDFLVTQGHLVVWSDSGLEAWAV